MTNCRSALMIVDQVRNRYLELYDHVNDFQRTVAGLEPSGPGVEAAVDVGQDMMDLIAQCLEELGKLSGELHRGLVGEVRGVVNGLFGGG